MLNQNFSPQSVVEASMVDILCETIIGQDLVLNPDSCTEKRTFRNCIKIYRDYQYVANFNQYVSTSRNIQRAGYESSYFVISQNQLKGVYCELHLQQKNQKNIIISP